MLGAMIGDMVGSVHEFSRHKGKKFELFDPHADFTDDSVLTAAVARALMDCEGDYRNLRERTIVRFKEYANLYPRPLGGYGSMFAWWVWTAKTDDPYDSYGNGAAMRVSPVAYAAKSLEEVKELAYTVTAVTHNHPEGIKGGEAEAVAVYMALQGASLEELEKTMRSYYDWDFTVEDLIRDYKFEGSCQETVPQAFQCFLESISYEDALRNAIAIGGDADTLGAIVGAIAEAFYGIPSYIRLSGMARLDKRLRKDVLDFATTFPQEAH